MIYITRQIMAYRGWVIKNRRIITLTTETAWFDLHVIIDDYRKFVGFKELIDTLHRYRLCESYRVMYRDDRLVYSAEKYWCFGRN